MGTELNVRRMIPEGLGAYAPLLALVGAIALIVAIAPSRATSPSSAQDVTATRSGGIASSASGGVPSSDATSATSSGGASAATTVVTGTTEGGASTTGSGPSGFDCSRNAVLRGKTCKLPWTGTSNGGHTYNGVEAKTINIVHFVAAQNEQVQTALGAAGIPSQADRVEVFGAWERYLNSVYQTYGRHVRLIVYYGTSMASDASGQQAEAVKVATELKAFAVMSPTANPTFYDELHRRGIPVLTNAQFPPELHQQRAPHFFGFTPDLRLTSAHVAEYVCKRLWNRDATHAGSPIYQSSKRKFGVIYQDAAAINLGKTIASQIEACGGKVALVKSYSPDVSVAVQQSTSIVASMRSANITSVICACDPIFPAYFTQQASDQGWFPEWIHNGMYGTDLTLFSRLYDQKQWIHSFGVSTLDYPPFSTSDPGWLAYKKGEPDGNNAHAVATSQLFFWMVRSVFDGIEAAGPNLNDRTFARALFSLPPIKIGRMATYSFGPHGPSPYTLVDDVMEVWWSSTRPGPDGKPGTFFYVNGGQRYRLGQWPRTEPKVFIDDGSPQPARDPNQ
jgi:hypothetical protein